MAGGQAFEFKRAGGMFNIRPELCVIIGRDTLHKRGEHPLFQETRGRREATPAGIAGIIDAGSRCPVICVVAEVIPDEMFTPEFLKVARKIRETEAVQRGETWDKSAHRWAVVDDGRGRVIHARAANAQLTDPIVLVASHEKLKAEDKVGAMMSANAYAELYTDIQKALDLIEFRRHNKSDDAACIKLNCDARTLALYQRIENDEGECALCAEVVAAVESGEVPFAKAVKWAALTVKEQREALKVLRTPRKDRAPSDARKAPSKKDAARVGAEVVAGKHPTIPREVGWALQILAGKMDATDYPELAALLAGKCGEK